jgi:hypothetical protein
VPKWRDLATGVAVVGVVVGFVVIRSLATRPAAGAPGDSASATIEASAARGPASASGAPTGTSLPSETASPTLATLPTAVPTVAATALPTVVPTAKPPPAPTPVPTPIPWLDQGNVDFGSPVTAGTQVAMRIFAMSAPATCSLQVRYADSTMIDLGTVVAVFDGEKPGATGDTYACFWTWHVSAGAPVGAAYVTWQVVYLGVTRFDGGEDVTIQAP